MELRFALIGCGQIGPRHAIQMAKFGKISAVCDILPEKADALAILYQCPAFYSIDELLGSGTALDVVAVCTPNYLHAAHTIRCLHHGFHVICEKPMAISSPDAEAMMHASRTSGRRLFIVKQNRYNPPVQAVKRLLDQDKLGKIHAFQVNCFWNRTSAYYASPWKGKKALDGGILYTQFSHFVDLLIWFLGEPGQVQTTMENYLLQDAMELEDTGFSLVKMKNGAVGTFNYTVTSYDHNMEGSITLFGATGTVKIGGQYLNTLDYFSVRDEEPPQITEAPANQYGFYQGSMSNHDKVYEDVVRSLGNRLNQVVEGFEAIKTIAMIEEMYGSATFQSKSASTR